MSIPRALAFIRRALASRRAERELHDEVEGYATLVADELEAAGVRPDEARRRARAEMGGVESVKESVRTVRAGAWLEQGWQDLRCALRGLRRSPGFAATALVTVGLGIGVNTTMFSVIDSALLKGLPYDHPDELVDLGHHVRAGQPMETTMVGLDWPEVAEWRAERDLFQGVASYKSDEARQWRENDETIRVGAYSAGLPALLGIRLRAGRSFTASETDTDADVVVIADALWNRAFGRSDSAIGSIMTIDGRRLTIVGVMPPSFRYGPGGGGRVMAWTALAEHAVPGVAGTTGASTIFRLRRGLTIASATALADAVAARMQRQHPSAEPWTAELLPLVRFSRDPRVGNQSPLLLLLGLSGVVLLVACVNVASLQVERGASRRQELAMRSALGASRGRIFRLLLAESLLTTLLGGAAAVVFAALSVGAVVALIPARLRGSLFAVSAPGIDWRVLAFAGATTAVVALLSAVWPALTSSQSAPCNTTGVGGQPAGLTRQRRRASRGLQAAQVALALVLAVTAARFGAGFVNVLRTDLGFAPEGLGVVSFTLPAGAYRQDASRRAAVAELLARVRAVPGVRLAASGNSPGAAGGGRFVLSGQPAFPGGSAIRTIGDGYFETAGIRIVAGRPVSAEDLAAGRPVAVIDEADARRVFGADSPIGRRFAYSRFVSELTIVGVAAHVATTDFTQATKHVGVYVADPTSQSFLIRTDGDLGSVLRGVQAVLKAFEPGIRIGQAGPATAIYDLLETYATPRLYVVLVSIFTSLALLTAAVGLYGLLAHSVARRRREIGVRVALGSTPGRIRSLVLHEALFPVGLGIVLGGVAAWWTAAWSDGVVYGVDGHDPTSFLAGAAVLLLAAALGALAPIRRATSVDPIRALRTE